MLLTLTSVLVAIFWHLRADPLSAEEQRLVGTWRRFDADGKHVRDERYGAERTYEERASSGLFLSQDDRWSLVGGTVSFTPVIPVSERIVSWTGGRYLSIGSYTFPSEGARNARLIRLIERQWQSTSDVRFVIPEPVFGETRNITSQEFPGEVHTLRRLLSETQPDSQNRVSE